MPDPIAPAPVLDHTNAHRIKAAEQTRGISSDIIYRPILGLLKDRDLGGDLLDYGAGAGNLTRLLVETGRFRSVTAADLIHPGEPSEKVRYLAQDLNQPLNEPDGSFDVLVACEVLEHLENPRAVVRDWCRLLRPGGTLIVSTPNVETWKSIFMLAQRGYFASFTPRDYPAHIVALIRSDFARIYAEVGLKPPQFCFTNSGLIPFLAPLTWQQISFGALRGVRYSDTIIAIATRG